MALPGVLTEQEVERSALAWLESRKWDIAYGPDLAPNAPDAERATYREVVLVDRLREALERLNPDLPSAAIAEATRKLQRPDGATIEARNREFHRFLAKGVGVEYVDDQGSVRGGQVKVIDFSAPRNNDWLAANQVLVVEGTHRRVLDIVLFLNGLPLVLIELKNAIAEGATIWTAYDQLQVYKDELPTLFTFNELLVASDGLQARVGALTAGREWFKRWRTVEGEELADDTALELQVLVEGMFDHERFLELLRDFIVYEDDGSVLMKKVAGYHQFHAVRTAVAETLRATAMAKRPLAAGRGGEPGDRRVGVIWHTQGSGKSLTMAFYVGRLAKEPDMQNPTVVVLTDRNDLDDQLFGAFARCSDILPEPPRQANSRDELRASLDVDVGGVIFTTIQKFFPDRKRDETRHPILSPRRNIVIIADEAHRTQYGFEEGFADHIRKALPNASFVGFTGTPIATADADTRRVFGNDISVYDVKRAAEDEATVPIYYESRLAALRLDEAERPRIDPNVEEILEGHEPAARDRYGKRWSELEVLVGSEKRLQLLAQDLVEHFDRRLEAIDGKAMVVCMSRRICVDLYDEIVRLRPEWHDDDERRGLIKVVMTGNTRKEPEWAQHIRSTAQSRRMAKRFRDPDDPLKMVIVCDMWLTGFDAPPLHTMYLDKPLKAHGLMQAIARVNRVYRDKPGGLVVDYLGVTAELRKALEQYTGAGGRDDAVQEQQKAVDVVREKYDICCGLFYGFDWSVWGTGSPQERLALLPPAQEHILALPADSEGRDGKDRLNTAVRALSRAFALAVPHEDALAIASDVAFFQAVRAALAKRAPGQPRSDAEVDKALREVVSRVVVPAGVVDVFEAAGLERPDISVLDERFLAEVQGMRHKNLAAELLRKLMSGEIREYRRTNVVQGKLFSERLNEAIARYHNRTISAVEVIETLLEIARDLREARSRGDELGLTDEEFAFYTALEANDSAVAVLGDDVLRGIAQELAETIRNEATVDWTMRENVRAAMRVKVKRILRKHGYPPDKQERAVKTVIEQAEAFPARWMSLDLDLASRRAV